MTIRTGYAGGMIAALLTGCGGSSSTPPPKPTGDPVAVATPKGDEAAEIAAELGKLSPEDKKLAEAQKVCPISGEKLGSMGVPPKLKLNGETVFVCCGSCQKGAEKDPVGTLKKVAEQKAKGGGK